MTSRQGSSKPQASAWSGTQIALLVVIAASAIGIVAILAGVPNPFTRERVASPEALQFYAHEVAPLDIAAKNVLREAEFNVGSRDTNDCLRTEGGTARCGELEGRFASFVTRMDELLAFAEALDPPSSDSTTEDWVAAFIQERSIDRNNLRALASAVAAGWDQSAWGVALQQFLANSERGTSDQALRKMVPGHLDFTPTQALPGTATNP